MIEYRKDPQEIWQDLTRRPDTLNRVLLIAGAVLAGIGLGVSFGSGAGAALLAVGGGLISFALTRAPEADRAVPAAEQPQEETPMEKPE